MKLLISGICGFVGSLLAAELRHEYEIVGFDNLIRPGSEINRRRLRELGIQSFHADMRSSTDLAALPRADWVIDAAALPSVLAGVDGRTGSRQVIEHNLNGTVNLLEYCREHRAGFVLLSTSRVYSIPALCALPLRADAGGFALDLTNGSPPGVSAHGISESFSTAPPVSLYGATKVASERLALEYGCTFDFPVWINRCGVLAGAGQFGRAEQGIFSFWIHSWKKRRPLRYIGFDGSGRQVRDALHPRDLIPLLRQQFQNGDSARPKIVNVAGGPANAMSLAQLSAWCSQRFAPMEVTSDPQPRTFDVPWLVLDSALAQRAWNWQPRTVLPDILSEIADHAEANPDWLDLCSQ